MRGGLVQIVAALALAASVFVTGCGSDDGEAGGLAELAPPDAPFYIEATVRPDDDQAAAIDSLSERFGIDPGAQLTAALDEGLASEGTDITYGEDIEPWLGDRVAMFVRSLKPNASGSVDDLAVLFEVSDEDAADAFVDKVKESSEDEFEDREYDGTAYDLDTTDSTAIGIVDDSTLVFGSEAAFKVAVDASSGESLAASEDYTSHLDPLPDDALGTAFFEPGTLVEASIASGSLDAESAQMLKPLLGGPLSEPLAAALTVEPDSASIDVASTVDSDAPDSTESSLLENLPGDSWLAAALPDLGPSLERNLDQVTNSGLPGARQLEAQIERQTGLDLSTDVFAWLGDVAGFVSGTGEPGIRFGVIAETSDPEGPRKLLASAQRLIERTSPPPSSGPPEGSDYGFSFGIPSLGGGAEAGVIDGMLVGVFGATVDQVLHPTSTLGDDEEYTEAIAALGEDMAPALFVSLPEFLTLAQRGSEDSLPSEEGLDYGAIVPYEDELGSLIAGSRHTDGLVITRATVTLAPQ